VCQLPMTLVLQSLHIFSTLFATIDESGICKRKRIIKHVDKMIKLPLHPSKVLHAHGPTQCPPKKGNRYTLLHLACKM